MNKYSALATSFALTLCLSACGGGSSTTTPAPEPQPEKNEKTLDDQFKLYLSSLNSNHIVPRYAKFAEQSAVFHTSAQSFCALSEQTNDDLELVKQQWQASNLAWQRIQWLKIGPVVDMLFRIQFWPDSNRAVARAIDAHLLYPETITSEYIATRNVGGQGFPAAEQLLYPANSEQSLLLSDDKEKRCQLMVAISDNLKNMSQQLNTAWQEKQGNYGQHLVQGSGEFSGVKDALEELVTNWLEQIEKVKDEKVLKPLGDASPGLPLITEHTLSDLSLASIVANIETFDEIYSAGNGHGFSLILSTFLQRQSIDERMQQAITDALASINQLSGSYTDALKASEKRVILQQVVVKLRVLRDIFTAEFVQVTDLNIGFNSNDGD